MGKAGTYTSPRLMYSAGAFTLLLAASTFGGMPWSIFQVLGGVALGGYFANNAIKGFNNKKN